MIHYIQLSKKHNFSDLKRRLADCLIQLGEAEATTDKIRIWSCQSKEKLLASFKQVSQAN